jgi:hypothetical protein
VSTSAQEPLAGDSEGRAPVASLATDLRDWRELEDVLVRLGRALGFFLHMEWEECRWVIHTANPLTDMLWSTLEALNTWLFALRRDRPGMRGLVALRWDGCC